MLNKKALSSLILLITFLLSSSNVYAIRFIDCELEDYGEYWLVVGKCAECSHGITFKDAKEPNTLIYKFGKTDSLDRVHDHTIIGVNIDTAGDNCPSYDKKYIIWWVGDIDDVKIYRPIYPSCLHYDTFHFLRSVTDSYVKVYKSVEQVSGIIPQEFGALKPHPSTVKDPDYDELPYVYMLEEKDWHFAGVYQDSIFSEDDNYWYVLGEYGSIGIYSPEYLNNPARDLTVYVVAFDGGDKEIVLEMSSDGQTWNRAISTVGKNITPIKIPNDVVYTIIVAPKGVAVYKKVYLTLLTPIPREPVPVKPPDEPIPLPDSDPEKKIVLPLLGEIDSVKLTILLAVSMASVVITVEGIKRGIKLAKKHLSKRK